MIDLNYDKKYKNTNKFRQAALHFQKYGYYTAAPKGTTEARKYWDEEIKRSLDGYHTEDGDYISGYNYFYLNYSPITLVSEKEIIDSKGLKRTVKERTQEFPDFWDSDKQFFDMVQEAEEQGKHLVTIKARGKGYSYKTASMLCRNYYLIRESKSYGIASEKEFLIKDGLLSKTWTMMDFIDEHTAWTKKRDKTNSLMHRKSSYIESKDGTNIEMGYKSEIIGVTLKNDVQKARGKRGKLILWEEAGKFPGLLEAWQIAQPSVEHTDGKAFGIMIAFGTGGTESGDFGSLKELFYSPEAYNALEIRNMWDTGADNTSCGFFVPQYVNMGNEFTDDQGNSLIIEAKKDAIRAREIVEKNSNNKNAIDRYIAERPFTPMEATLQLAGNIFPKKELAEQIARIQVDRKLNNYKQVGELIFEETGKLKWIQTKDTRDILKYPLDRTDSKKGAIVIWEHPPVDNIPHGLYIGGCDPYDHDDSGTGSLGSTFIYKRFQGFESYYDVIVAEYTGRPDTANEYYENVRKLLIYYNAVLLYENERKGIFPYFTSKSCDYLLADQPDIIGDIVRKSTVTRKKGVHMVTSIKDWGERELRDWLNEEISPGVKQLTRIMSVPLLQELIAYNSEGNFDRCCIAGTQVHTQDSYCNIEDLKIGDKVLTHTGNFKDVIWTDKSKLKNKLIDINLTGTNEILTVTDNHPLLIASVKTKKHNTRKNIINNVKWETAKNILESDRKYNFLLQPKRKNLKKPQYQDDLLYLIGWILADGSISGGKLRITLDIKQEEIADKLIIIIEKYTRGANYNGKLLKKARKNIFKTSTGGYINIEKNGKEFINFLHRVGCEPNNKHISSSLYNSKNLLSLVIGFLEGDGHQKKYNNYDGYKRSVIECAGTHLILIKQIRQILIDEGIWASINTKNINSDRNIQYCLNISGKYVDKLLSSYKSIKFNKQEYSNKNDKNNQIETNSGFWIPIKNINYSNIKTEYVYNIEVEEDHSYVANNCVNHNCMALMMVMIYKKELHKVHVKEKTNQSKSDPFLSGPIFARERTLNFNIR